jgi:DNA-binding HxlR family transcriptional regulator
MAMSWDEVCETNCPTARALSVVGDRWTLLILREMTMGVHRFDDIQAQTGMSSFLLSTRLKRLESDGIVERRRYSEHPVRYEYHQTTMGKGFDRLLLALRAWGLERGGFAPGGKPSTRLTHKRTGKVIAPQWNPEPEDRPFTFDQVTTKLSPAFAAEREAKREAFRLSRRAAKD